MLLEQAIRQLLLADETVAEMVESARVYPGVAGQKAEYPLCVYGPPRGENRQIIETLEGGVNLYQEDLIFLSVSKGRGNYDAAALLDIAIFDVLNEYSGTITSNSSPSDELTVQGVFPVIAHSYDGFGDENETHNFISRYRFHYVG